MFVMRAKMISVGLLGAAISLPIDCALADQLGHASWYSLPSNITANGEKMDPNELTAAHRSLPFGTRVLVENLSNGRTVVVRINDRGPFIGGRIIDLSKAAADSLGMIEAGTARVRVITAANSVLAALGEATAKAKAKAGADTGVASAANAKTEVTGTEATAVASNATLQTVAANASAGQQLAEAVQAKSKFALAMAPKLKTFGRPLAVSSDKTYVAAYQNSPVADDRFSGSSERHPYPVLTGTPSLIESSRTRRIG